MQSSENIQAQMTIKVIELRTKLDMMLAVNVNMKVIGRPVVYSDTAVKATIASVSEMSETCISELDQLDKGLL